MKGILIVAIAIISQTHLAQSLCEPGRATWNLGNYDLFPCNQYFKVCRNHHEGREGLLRLPVKQDMTPPLLDVFEYGDINITFSEPLNALDVSEGDHGRRISTSNQAFTLFIKDVYRDRMEGLKDGDTFSLDITYRSQILKPEYKGHKKLGIVSLSFGKFVCPEPPPPAAVEPIIPKCHLMMLDNSITDGYRAYAVFNVPSNTKQWMSEINFQVPIRNFDTPTGDKTVLSDRSFKITSLRHNGRKHKDQEFKLEFTIHVEDETDKWKSTQIASMKFNEFYCEGVIIRWRSWN